MEVITINNATLKINLNTFRVKFNYMVHLVHPMLFLSIIDGGVKMCQNKLAK